MLTVRHDAPLPIADQIVAGLRELIARRRLTAGSRLPTVRQLAGDLGVNMNTVSRAYRVLEGQGLVSTRRGRGTVVTAEREPGPAPDVRALTRDLRRVLADARLAGLDRIDVKALCAAEIRTLWPDEEDPR